MTRHFLIFIVLLVISGGTFAQEQLTTFIIVRHAERADDGSGDPDISEVGKERASRLSQLLSKTAVNAIYSTGYKRTRNTVTPLANAKGLQISSYEALNGQAIDKMLKDHAGGIIVVSGHSNTVPWTVNYLTGNNQLKDFADDDFSNVLVVSVLSKGKVTSVTWLSY